MLASGNVNECHRFARGIGLAVVATLLLSASAGAYDGPVRKQAFTMPAYTTVGGRTLKDVRVGYETYGTLNADRTNVILISHHLSGTSHAAGKYLPTDQFPGYWDSIIGAGRPIDTTRFYVIATDSLVNLNVKDPNTVTTGPASLDPATGKPYGLTFPIVTIRDFVNVQKALVDSLDVKKLHAVIGPAMGAFQSLEWAAAYPDVVERVVAVGGGAEFHAHTIGWSALWAEPIRLDPRWNGGNYYGRPEPVDGMRVALKIITLHARAPGWAGKSFGRKWAAPDKDPAAALEYRFAIEDTLEKLAAGRAALYDANAFLYLVKANQLFVVGGAKAMDDGLRAIKAPVLLIAATSDLIVFPEFVRATADALRKQGGRVEYAEIQGDGGHFDAILGVAQAAETIRTFLGR